MSLLVWLPLINDTDNQGFMDLPEPSYNRFTANTDGKLGSCHNIYHVYHSDEEFLGNTWSIATWVKRTTAWSPTGNTILACKNLNTAGSDCQIYFSVYKGNVHINANGYSPSGGVNGTTALTTDTWYHVAATYDGTTLKAYLNGTLEGSKTISAVQPTGSYNLGIGCRSGSDAGTDQAGGSTTNFFNDFRLYDHCLSAKEIKLISQGLVAHYPLNDMAGGENLLLDSERERSFKNGAAAYYFPEDIHDVLTAGDTVTFSADIKSDTELESCNCDVYFRTNSAAVGSSPDIIGVTNEYQHFSVSLSVPDADYTQFRVRTNSSVPGSDTSATYNVKNAKLEKGSKDILYSDVIYDTSGYRNNGIMSSNPPAPDPDSPRYAVSMKFNGTDNFIAAGRGGMVRDAITISWWGYMDDWSNYSTTRAISCSQSGGWNFESVSNKLCFLIGTGSDSNTYKEVPTKTTVLTTLSTGWHFFAGTYDGLVAKIFIDGIEDNSLDCYTTKTPIFYHVSNGIFIGAEAGTSQTVPESGRYFNGKLSDVRIYATALSADDILDLYTASASVDNEGNFYARELSE